MGRKCSVESCTSDSTKSEHAGVTYHKIPPHTDVRPKWLALCHIPEEKLDSKLLYVCSRHFLRADFCNFKGKKYLLKQGVLPSVFPWDKSRLDAIKAVAKKDDIKTKNTKKSRAKVTKSTEVEGNQSEESHFVRTEIKDELVDIKQEAEANTTENSINSEPLSQAISSSREEVLLGSKSEIKEESPIGQEETTDSFDQHQRSQNASPVSITPAISFCINSKIEVLDNNSVWHLGKINEVDYEENEVLVHFEKSNKCDEWISMSSSRLRPLQSAKTAETRPEEFEVGDRCMATWSDYRKFPAAVTKKLDNDIYEVLFDDGFTKVLKGQKISKMSVIAKPPPKPAPLFEPVKTTKQERRDKKRKLNVAALFTKKPKLSTSFEKKNKAAAAIHSIIEETCSSPGSQTSQEDLSINDVSSSVTTKAITAESSLSGADWRPKWLNGKPIGVESTIEGIDGIRKSTIVADPKLPPGWTKHLTQRTYGQSIGKWDAIIVSPDGKKFRTRQDIQTYLDLHPGIEATIEMFDFSMHGKKRRSKTSKKKKKKALKEAPCPPVEEPEPQPTEESQHETSSLDSEEVQAPEEPPVSLKIVFENDAYKCPIDGCDKTFRRENLALMHVKHYHSEYTKYLDSTPNVADLAYARTVGENLDRSPGPAKTAPIKTERPTSTPKTPKAPPASSQENEHAPILDRKQKDSEIIKLLNQKSPDVNSESEPLPPGLPSNMYPDIKLKDLLGKTDDIAMRDDVHIKSLCSSRPSQGIKTLLPVRHPSRSTPDASEEKARSKRKKAPLENQEAAKVKKSLHTPPSPKLVEPSPSQHLPSPHHSSHEPTTADVNSQPPPSEGALEDVSPIPSAFDLAPPPAGLESAQAPTVTQFDGVIIEGGKIIKLERMKQEEIINCTCGFVEEDGLMIQCELCLCWQHAYCSNIQKESEVPEKYVCYICQHPVRERRSAKYLHDQDWLKLGVLPVASYHSKDKPALERRFEKLKKSHDVSGGLLELREYLNTLAVKLKIAEAKDHPKLYLWSKAWEKRKLPEKMEVKEESQEVKPESEDLHREQNEYGKQENGNQSMLMMILKSAKEDVPMLNMPSGPIIPRPEAAIDSDDCRLNLLSHIAHAETLVEDRLDDFERQLEALEEGINLETEEDYPRTRQTVELLMRDLDTLKQFSELPMM